MNTLNPLPDSSTLTVRILCVGEEEAGKSTFLTTYIDPTMDYKQVKDSPCSIFSQLELQSLDRPVWVEFYELSNSYPDYMGCYMEKTYDAVVFFYDLTDKRSRNRLYVWMRLIQQYKGQSFWELPVLLIGLKKNEILEEQLEDKIQDVVSQFRGIFKHRCFLYAGNTVKEARDLLELTLFVKRIITGKYKNSTEWEKYRILKSMRTYNFMYTYYEMAMETFQVVYDRAKETVEAMNLGGIARRASQVYLQFTEKLSTY